MTTLTNAQKATLASLINTAWLAGNASARLDFDKRDEYEAHLDRIMGRLGTTQRECEHLFNTDAHLELIQEQTRRVLHDEEQRQQFVEKDDA